MGWIQEGATLDYPLEELDKVNKFATAEPGRSHHGIPTVGSCGIAIAMGRYQSCRYTLVEMKPHTGRKHQLRRHMHP